jgi:hypothetical protein
MRTFTLTAAVFLGFVGIAEAEEDPFHYCRRVTLDDNPRPAPASLVPALAMAFNESQSTVRERLRFGAFRFRCYQGAVMGCSMGANLNCGKADTRTRNDGADAYCRENPNDPNIPAVATGHATVLRWHCVGTHAVASRGYQPVDPRGFDLSNWQVLHE